MRSNYGKRISVFTQYDGLIPGHQVVVAFGEGQEDSVMLTPKKARKLAKKISRSAKRAEAGR